LDSFAQTLSPAAFTEFQTRKCRVAIRLFRFLSLCEKSAVGAVFGPAVLDDPAFYSLLFSVLMNPDAVGFSLSANPRRIRHLQRQCGVLAKYLLSAAASGAGMAAAAGGGGGGRAAKRRDVLLRVLLETLRDPSLSPSANFTVEAMTRRIGFASVLANAYYELFSAGLLTAALGPAKTRELAQHLAEQSFVLAVTHDGNASSVAPSASASSSPAGAAGGAGGGGGLLPPVHRHVGMQLLSLALHIGVSNDQLFGYLANAQPIGRASAAAAGSGSGGGSADSKSREAGRGSALASGSSATSASAAAAAPAFTSKGEVFYHNYRALLDSYTVHTFSAFSRPLLRAMFSSRELFEVLLNVVSALVASKVKHQHARRLHAMNIANAGLVGGGAGGPAAMAVDDGRGGEVKGGGPAADTKADGGSASGFASKPVEDVGWDFDVRPIAASAAAMAGTGADGSPASASSSAAESDLVVVGVTPVHSGNEIDAFVGELLKHLATAFAASSRPGPGSGSGSGSSASASSGSRPITDLERDEETLTLLLTLFDRLIALDHERLLASPHASSDLLQSSVLMALSPSAPGSLKRTALGFVDALLSRSRVSGKTLAVSEPVVKAIGAMVMAPPFPSRSSDLERDSAVWHTYIGLLDGLLRAWVSSRSFRLMEVMLPLVRERGHAHGPAIRRAARAFVEGVAQPGAGPLVRETAEKALGLFLDRALDDSPVDNARHWIVAQIAVPLLRIGTRCAPGSPTLHAQPRAAGDSGSVSLPLPQPPLPPFAPPAPLSVVEDFFTTHGVPIMKLIEAKPNGPTVSKE
jgi:hypothetical protein